MTNEFKLWPFSSFLFILSCIFIHHLCEDSLSSQMSIYIGPPIMLTIGATIVNIFVKKMGKRNTHLNYLLCALANIDGSDYLYKKFELFSTLA